LINTPALIDRVSDRHDKWHSTLAATELVRAPGTKDHNRKKAPPTAVGGAHGSGDKSGGQKDVAAG